MSDRCVTVPTMELAVRIVAALAEVHLIAPTASETYSMENVDRAEHIVAEVLDENQ